MQQFVYWAILVVFCGIVGLVAYENSYSQTIRVLDHTRVVSFSSVIGWVFILGMLTGWVFLGMLRNLIQRVSEAEE
jgi:hypothetical protein